MTKSFFLDSGCLNVEIKITYCYFFWFYSILSYRRFCTFHKFRLNENAQSLFSFSWYKKSINPKNK